MSTNFTKNPQYRILRKSVWWESTFMRTNRQSKRHDETSVGFRNCFAKRFRKTWNKIRCGWINSKNGSSRQHQHSVVTGEKRNGFVESCWCTQNRSTPSSHKLITCRNTLLGIITSVIKKTERKLQALKMYRRTLQYLQYLPLDSNLSKWQ
jgi:hypothetical protein